jgi:hypothetical protein
VINISNQPSLGEQYLQITYRTFPPPDIVTPRPVPWYEQWWDSMKPRCDKWLADAQHDYEFLKTWLKKIFFLTV